MRPKQEPGTRAGAILSADREEVRLLGYGVYEGMVECEALGGQLNPKINLDSGETVWGYQCWWGPEDVIRAGIGTRSVVDVTMADALSVEKLRELKKDLTEGVAIDTEDFSDVKVGDVVTRMLAGEIPMQLKVTDVTEDHICCGPGNELRADAEGWRFDRKTGVEEDEDLGWGVRFGITGSYLVKEQA